MKKPNEDANAQRASMRARALAEREAVPVARRAVWEAAIAYYLDALIARIEPQVLAFCWPFRAEPDVRGWVENWLDGDTRRVAALPVVTEQACPLVFRRWTPGAELVPDRYGIPFPPQGEALLPDVVLIPLNAFDARGYRLGYGGGYFDRTLAVISPLAIGIGFELGRKTDVLPQPHDRPVNWLVTEAGAALAVGRVKIGR